MGFISRAMEKYKNSWGLLALFLPIITTGIIFLGLEYTVEKSGFEEAEDYFRQLQINRVIILSFVVLTWNFLKKIISGYVILFILLVFNIMLVVSDISNISRFEEIYKEKSDQFFYKLFYIRNFVNYVYLCYLVIALIANVRKWYQIYKNNNPQEIHQD